MYQHTFDQSTRSIVAVFAVIEFCTKTRKNIYIIQFHQTWMFNLDVFCWPTWIWLWSQTSLGTLVSILPAKKINWSGILDQLMCVICCYVSTRVCRILHENNNTSNNYIQLYTWVNLHYNVFMPSTNKGFVRQDILVGVNVVKKKLYKKIFTAKNYCWCWYIYWVSYFILTLTCAISQVLLQVFEWGAYYCFSPVGCWDIVF
jgi:hypothetical protein